MNEEHTNGNGNGNGKTFVVAAPKSPDQIKWEHDLKIVPQLRRNCSKDRRLSLGAKWLYCQMTDNNFYERFGGDGKGRVYLSLMDLQRIYGHDRETFGKWRDELVNCGWMWFQESWPKACWGIMGLCQQPELFTPPLGQDYMRVMAKASGDLPVNAAGPPENDKTEDFLRNRGENPRHLPVDAATPAGESGNTCRQKPQHLRHLQAGIDRQTPQDLPVDAATPAGESRNGCGKNRPTPEAESRNIEESPIGVRSKGASECVAADPPTHRIPSFEELDRKVVIRKRPELGNSMIERCQARINALQQSRQPVAGAKEAVAAYRQRIKDVKKWMAGEL